MAAASSRFLETPSASPDEMNDLVNVKGRSDEIDLESSFNIHLNVWLVSICNTAAPVTVASLLGDATHEALTNQQA